jgi:anti-sigma-K factor RskA
MSGPDFDELVGEDLTDEERERLERAHDLLLAAGPLPELPPYLEHPHVPEPAEVIPFFNRRRSAVLAIAAAAIAAAAFGGGYLAGHHRGGEYSAVHTVRMHGTSLAPNALASIQLGEHDAKGNWPMRVRISNLPKLPAGGYYTIWLTRNGKAIAPCGTFRAEGDTTTVSFTEAYRLKHFDGWVVTRWLGPKRPVATVMTT